MKHFKLIAAAIAGSISAARFDQSRLFSASAWRGPTPSRKLGLNKNGLPSGYPGAKLARKAAQGKLTLRHG